MTDLHVDIYLYSYRYYYGMFVSLHLYHPLSIHSMDSREDLVRVSVGSVQDWQRLKANYKNAILARLEENILTNGLAAEREELIAHTNKVDYLSTRPRPF